METKKDVLENLWNSSDLAVYLNISKSQVDKLRSYSPSDLPTHIKIGHSVRYCPKTVRSWVYKRMHEISTLSKGETI